MPATIVMPADAPAAKLAATRGYGAEVVTLRPRARRTAPSSPARSRRERGATLVPPYDDPADHRRTRNGRAGADRGRRAARRAARALGGGGLLAGCVLAATALSPGRRASTASSRQAGDDWVQSWRAERIVSIPVPQDDRRRPADAGAGRADLADRARARGRRRHRQRRRDPRRDALRVRAAQARRRTERRVGARRAALRQGRRRAARASASIDQRRQRRPRNVRSLHHGVRMTVGGGPSRRTAGSGACP